MRAVRPLAAPLAALALVGPSFAPPRACAQAEEAPSAGASAEAALPAEALVAVVGGATPGPDTDVVYLSDVELRARLELAARGAEVPLGPLPRALLAATLEQIVGELLVAREAERLHLADPSDADVVAQRARLAAGVGGEDALARAVTRAGASMAELDAIALRRAVVASFFRANLEGGDEVADEEVERAYAAGEHPFGDAPLDAVREPLRRWLAERALERDVRRWLEVLRARTTVRVHVLPERGLGVDEAPRPAPSAPGAGGPA